MKYVVYIESEEARAGSEVSLVLGMDTQGERLNLFEARLPIPEGVEVMRLNTEGSFVNIWVREPVFDKASRTISMIGGVPGGIEGSGVLARIFVRPQKSGDLEFAMRPDSAAYLNDGLGTAATVEVIPDTIIVEERKELYNGTWRIVGAILLIAAVGVIWWKIRRKIL